MGQVGKVYTMGLLQMKISKLLMVDREPYQWRTVRLFCGNSFERVSFVYQELILSIILDVAISSDITNHCSDINIAKKLDPIRTGANFLSVLVKRPGSTGST
jgi:hypothetical protein